MSEPNESSLLFHNLAGQVRRSKWISVGPKDSYGESFGPFGAFLPVALFHQYPCPL